MADKMKIGPKIVLEGEKEYKQSISEVNKTLSVLASESKKTSAAYSDNANSLKALTEKSDNYKKQVEAQREKVRILTEAYENSKNQLGENSSKTQDWLIKLNNAQAALIKTEKALSSTEKAIESENEKIKLQSTAIEKIKDKYKEWKDKLEELKEKHPALTKAMEKTKTAASKLAKGGLTVLKGAGVGAAAGITAVSAAGVAAFKELSEISEETKELRDNLGKLETAFTTNGHSANNAKATYTDLYAVLGDSDKATEAANHLALLTKNQEQLADWVNISTGVYGTFGDSLPIESLTEAANETSKTGKLTGALADALNWVGVNEEDFQAKLDSCSTEQERQALITKTLNGLYSDAANKYREVSGTLIDAQKAQAEWSLSLADLGGEIENIKNEAIASFLPGITDVVNGLTGLLSGDEGAPELIKNGFNEITENLDSFLPRVSEILGGITGPIAEIAPQILTDFVTAILDNLDGVLDAAFSILNTLTEGLVTEDNIVKLVSAALELVTKLVEFLGDNSELIINSAFTMIDALIDGLLEDDNTKKLVKGALDIVAALAFGLIENAPELISGAFELIGTLVDTIIHYDWGSVARRIFDGIKDGIKRLVTGDDGGNGHAGGLDYVPYDGYQAVLHRGEKLLTASEAVAYDRNQGGNSAELEMLSRKVDKLAQAQSVNNINIVANGTAAGVVRALKLDIQNENERSSVFHDKGE